MTGPAGLEGLWELRAEVGDSGSRLHLEYAMHNGIWERTEQTYLDGRATSNEVHTTVDWPIDDLVSEAADWGGPIDTIEVHGADPDDLWINLQATLDQGAYLINGQVFTDQHRP